MDGTVVRLSTPVESFGTNYTELVLREPKGALFARLGLPRIAIVNQSTGSGYWAERDDVIAAYLEQLIDLDIAEKTVVLAKISLTDSLRLREALFDFFGEAVQRVAALRPAKSASASNS